MLGSSFSEALERARGTCLPFEDAQQEHSDREVGGDCELGAQEIADVANAGTVHDLPRSRYPVRQREPEATVRTT